MSTVFLFSGLMLIVCSCLDNRPSQKPNLLFVFSDQHSYDMLGCYGNEQVITPNLDLLASEGLLFSNCFSNCPLCTPFRGILMSGQHTMYNGCFDNNITLVPGNGKKFAEVLRDEGYSTAYIGKWHLLGGDRDRPVPEGGLRYGFDEVFLSNNCHMDFRPGKCFYFNEKGDKMYFDTWEVYGQTSQALEYLESRKGNKKPFALFVSWHPPHNMGKFQGKDGKEHFNYATMEEFMSQYDPDSIKYRPGMEDSPDLREMYHGYLANVTGVDEAFGRLMKKLKEIDQDENTIVIYTSDHGDMLEFEEADKPKQYPHDYSTHIPFIIRYPGVIEKGISTGLLFSSLDMMPSILGLMDLPVPLECQGKNLSAAILSMDEDAVDYIPIWMYTSKNWRGVVTKDYSYARAKNEEQSEEYSILYDRKHDPFQLNNLYYNTDYDHIKNELWSLTSSWMETYSDHFYDLNDFRKVANEGNWISPPFEQPIERFSIKVSPD